MSSISGIDHFCITVSDMEKSKKWYQEILGLKVVGEFEFDLPQVGEGVGLPGARFLETLLKWEQDGEGVAIELLCYLNPVGKKYDPETPMCDIGCSHVAFKTVGCIDELYKEMVKKGVRFYTAPQKVVIDGKETKFCYLKDPDGITLELIGT